MKANSAAKLVFREVVQEHLSSPERLDQAIGWPGRSVGWQLPPCGCRSRWCSAGAWWGVLGRVTLIALADPDEINMHRPEQRPCRAQPTGR